jgi:hypothetical protein
VLGKVNVGDTRTQVLERLGCSGGLFDKNNLGLLGEDCITLEGTPYQFREPPTQQNGELRCCFSILVFNVLFEDGNQCFIEIKFISNRSFLYINRRRFAIDEASFQ